MHIEIQRVVAEAVNTAVKPEPDGFEQRLAHVGIVKVEVGLRGQEVVQVILAAPRVPGPGRATEHGQPVVGGRAVRPRVCPHVPVMFGVGLAGAALFEPLVRVGGVRDYLVDHDLEAKLVGPGDEPVEILQRAEQRVNRAIILDIIAKILHRRFEERAEPDGVNAEICNVVEVRGNAVEIANAVAIGVGEGARVNLVNDRAAPPGGVGGSVLRLACRRLCHVPPTPLCLA